MSVTLVSGARRRRADAQRSIDAIVTAARSVLSERPDARMEEIAAAAGTTRQTVYAHFPSRDALIAAVFHSIKEEGMAALEAADLDDLPPVDAMRKFLDISWHLLERCTVLLEPMVVRHSTPMDDDSHHGVATIIGRIVERGQESGDFDHNLPLDWLITATHSLGHMAAEQVMAGTVTTAEAAVLLETSVLQLLGADRD